MKESRTILHAKNVKSFHRQILKWITHHKEIESDLRNSQEFFQKVLENTTNAIFLIDLNGNFTFLNKASAKISGYKLDELMGKHFSILFNKSSMTNAKSRFNKIVLTGGNISQVETHIVRKDGSKRFITFSLAAIYQKDNIASIVGTAEDITRHKYAENLLQQQAVEYEALSHISRALIQAESEEIIYDQIPKIISNFFGFEIVSIELYDSEKDEIIFMGSTGLEFVDKTTFSESTKCTVSGDVIKNGKAIVLENVTNNDKYEFNLLRKLDIKTFACFPLKIKETVIGTLCLAGKKKVCIHGSMRIILQTIADTIAQAIKGKHAETKIKEYQHDLEELVNERTEELEATQEKLIHAAKLSAVGKLSASIAHEFNNPICGIRNVLERINDRISDCAKIDETHKELTVLAIKECNRIVDLIRKLQDFHRPSSGIITKMNIHNAIDEIILLSQKKLNERNIVLTKHYAKNVPKIESVADQIKQVILNLVQNAEEAISKKRGKITITTEKVNSSIQIHITDNGIGIPQQHIDTVFEPFFTTKSAVKGTGLGLSISYGIIKKHGGSIELNSLSGKGTTFTIILPIKTRY